MLARFVTLLSVLVTILALAACRSGPAVGAETPEFTATDAQGETITAADYEGRILVMDFWATWCGPCRASSPQVQALHEEFAGDSEVEVLAIHVDGSGDPVAYMNEHGYTYRHVPRGQSVAKAYGVSSLPTFLVIDESGEVVHRQTGRLDPDYREKLADVVRNVKGG